MRRTLVLVAILTACASAPTAPKPAVSTIHLTTTTNATEAVTMTTVPPVTTTTAPAPPITTTTTRPRPPSTTRPQAVGNDDRLFILIGRCEQPGNGWEGVNWTHRGSYNGGLGILNVNWTVAARALNLPSPAYLASPAQQIAGARYHAAHHSFNGWTCWRRYHRQWGY